MSKNTEAETISAKPLYSTSVGLNIDKDTKVGFLLPFIKVIIAALGAGGAVLSYFPVIMPHMEMPPVFLITSVICVICWAALYLGKWGNALVGGMYLALGALVYKMYDTLYLGYKVIFNEFYSETHMRQYAGVEFYSLSAYDTEEIKNAAYTAILFFTAAAALLEGSFIVYRTAVVPAFLATLFPFEMTLYFGLVPDFFYSAAVICSWMAAAAAEAAELPVSGKDRRRSAYYRVSGQSALTAALAAALCLAVAGAGVYYSGFERPDSIKHFRRDFSRYMANFSWDKFRNDLAALNPINPNLSGATNHGRLGRTDEITFTDEAMLNVTLPKRGDNVYIRGFIGSDYTGNSWTECCDNEKLSAELSHVVSEFKTEGLQPLFMDGYTLEDHMEVGFDDYQYPTESIFIEKKGANSDTVYLPYFIRPSSAEKIEISGDKPLTGDNMSFDVFGISTKRQRTFIAAGDPFDDDMYEELFSFSFGSEDLTDDEELYCDFVYDNYLGITPEFTAAKAIYGDTEFTELYDELYAIRRWLGDNCSYDLSAGRLPFGKDFAQYFLTESKKGSCSHFATAAALMCRYRGIPTRYVEGYVIKPEDFPQNAKNGDNVTVTLTDERAHAWIEVYLDGYGWMPYEMTPGYGSELMSGQGTEIQENSEISAEIDPYGSKTETEIETQTEVTTASAENIGTEETETASDTQSAETETADSTPAENTSEKRQLAPVFAVIAVLIIPAAVAAFRYMNVTRARNRLLTGRNSRKKARAAGKYFTELCGYKNIRRSRDMSAEEFGRYAEEAVAELDSGSAEIITNAALAADYSENFPDAEDADSAAAAAVRFAGKLWENMGTAERFVFKYIRCLK